MIAGVSGSMLSSGFLARHVQEEQQAVAPEFDRWVRATTRWWQRTQQVLGPASPPRLVFDVGARPLLELLGYRVAQVEPQAWGHAAVLGVNGAPVAALLTTAWGAPPASAWRQALRSSLAVRLPWALVFSGNALTVVDGARPWTRRQLSFDLEFVCRDRMAMLALWTLAHADALHAQPSPSRLAQALSASDAHGLTVCASLGAGVLDALTELVSALDAPPSLAVAPHARRPASSTSRSPSSTACCSCCSPRRGGWCRAGIRSIGTGYTIEALRPLVESRVASRTASGRRSRRLRASRIAGCRAGSCA